MSTALLDLDKLIIDGKKGSRADLLPGLTGLTMDETITGASTITVTVEDPARKVLRSGLVSGRSIMILDGAGFELAAVRKAGDGLTLTFEDIAVAGLRKPDSFRKVKAGQMSRAQFIGDLVRRDTSWVKVHTIAGPKAKVELSRGKAKGAHGAKAEVEDTWDAATRIMGEIGWRVFARRGELWLVPDSYLLMQTPYKLTEATPGVDDVDFDFDVGKPAATGTIVVRAGKTTLRAGAAVDLSKMGPGDGHWLVEKITRTAASKTATVSLLRPQPTLPEPKPTDTGGEHGELGFQTGNLSGGALNDDGSDIRRSLGQSDRDNFVRLALTKLGKPYVWGHSGPSSFDCSGFVQWCAHQIGWTGVHKPVTAIYAHCQAAGQIVSVAAASRVRGALLIRVGRGGTNHVAISLGDGRRTVEAMGKAYGVCIGNSGGGRFVHGAILPEMLSSGGRKVY